MNGLSFGLGGTGGVFGPAKLAGGLLISQAIALGSAGWAIDPRCAPSSRDEEDFDLSRTSSASMVPPSWAGRCRQGGSCQLLALGTALGYVEMVLSGGLSWLLNTPTVFILGLLLWVVSWPVSAVGLHRARVAARTAVDDYLGLPHPSSDPPPVENLDAFVLWHRRASGRQTG